MRKALLAFPPVLALAGCSASGGPGTLVVGTIGTGGATGSSGNGGSTFHISADASVSNKLSARLESPVGVTVEFITLSCSNACADILAVAKGGVAPYSYAWNDGGADPARRVCPSASTSYAVRVTDKGSMSGEFRKE